MKIIEGNVVAEGIKIGIVASRFNEFIVSKLLGGARDALVRHGVNDDDITAACLPKDVVVPITISTYLKSSGYFSLISFGIKSCPFSSTCVKSDNV